LGNSTRFVTAIDSNRLYTNNGDRTFTDFSGALGVEEGDWGWGAAFIDIENDGDLDIMMTNGFLHSDRPPQASQERAFEPMRLWRNDDGVYNDVSEEYGVNDLREGRALVTFDYDNDGDLDVYVANNGSPPTFYRNDIESDNNWIRFKLNGVSSNSDGIGARVELVSIEGAVGSVYRVERAKLFDSGFYTAEALNTVGSILSAPMEVSVDWDISGFSVARAWNEVLLDAIRKDFPAPTIHSRNLYHVSVAIWDAFWAFEEDGWSQATPAFHKEEVNSSSYTPDRPSAQREAISYAPYRILRQRHEKSVGRDYSFYAFDWLMNELGYDPDFEGVDGSSPAAIGNRIGYALISQALSDGSNEENEYADTSGYTPSNDPLVIRFGGTTLKEPNRWQPLAFDARITQNGILIG